MQWHTLKEIYKAQAKIRLIYQKKSFCIKKNNAVSTGKYGESLPFSVRGVACVKCHAFCSPPVVVGKNILVIAHNHSVQFRRLG